MLQLCLFGGYEGPLAADKKCFLTAFGGCTLKRPTLARQLIASQRMQEGRAPVPKLIVVTLFGSTEIKAPTLTEEFLDLREASNSGGIDPNRWDFYMAELDRWQSSSMMSFTMFATFGEVSLPSDDEEIEGLALQRHFGNISEDSGRILEMGVGQAGSQRRSIIRQALTHV